MTRRKEKALTDLTDTIHNFVLFFSLPSLSLRILSSHILITTMAQQEKGTFAVKVRVRRMRRGACSDRTAKKGQTLFFVGEFFRVWELPARPAPPPATCARLSALPFVPEMCVYRGSVYSCSNAGHRRLGPPPPRVWECFGTWGGGGGARGRAEESALPALCLGASRVVCGAPLNRPTVRGQLAGSTLLHACGPSGAWRAVDWPAKGAHQESKEAAEHTRRLSSSSRPLSTPASLSPLIAPPTPPPPLLSPPSGRPRPNAQGRRHHGRDHARGGPHRRGGRRGRGHGAGARARGHPPRRRRRAHERPVRHHGHQGRRHHPGHGQGPHRPLCGGPDSGEPGRGLRGRVGGTAGREQGRRMDRGGGGAVSFRTDGNGETGGGGSKTQRTRPPPSPFSPHRSSPLPPTPDPPTHARSSPPRTTSTTSTSTTSACPSCAGAGTWARPFAAWRRARP